MDMGASLPPVLPEMVLLAGAVGTLLAGSFAARDRQWIVRIVAIGVLLVSGGFALAGPAGLIHPGKSVFTGTFTPDAATGAVRLTVIVATLLVIGLGRALGETIAVALVLSSGFIINSHITEPGGDTFASTIALKFGEASSNNLGIPALITAGLFLRALQRMLIGPVQGLSVGFTDLHRSEITAVGLLMALSLAIGVFPRSLNDVVEPAARVVVAQVDR